MKKSRILTLILSGVILASSASPVFAAANSKVQVKTVQAQQIELDDEIDFDEDFDNFDDFIEPIKDDLSKDEIKKLEKLYEDAVALEEKEKFDEADKIWDKIFSITDKYEDFDEELPSFKDFIKDLEGIYDKKDLPKIEKVYNKIVDLEKNNKYDESDKLWDDLFELLDKGMDGYVENITFEDFIKDFSKDLKKDELKKLEDLYSKALELDKKGKYDDADKIWDEILDEIDENFNWEECEDIDK